MGPNIQIGYVNVSETVRRGESRMCLTREREKERERSM